MAGENAWFNKHILASKIAVGIGLISYPLYLWHWVLLSFIRITEIENPKPLIKLLLILMSIILAWATYYFVEKKIRFHKNNNISLYLFIALISIGSLGYIVQQQKGYPSRFKDYNGSIAQITPDTDITIKNGILFKECQAKFPNADFCLIQDNKMPPTALLVGDSHAHHLYSGLIKHTALTGGNLLNLGVGDCFPFFDNSNYPNEKCRPLVNQALELAVANPSVKTIILAGRALTDINEQTFLPKKHLGFFPNIDSEATIEYDPYVLFKKGMKNTLQRLINTHKTIIFVLDIPDLEFEPAVCISRPWRLSGVATKIPCAIPRSHVDKRRHKYINMIKNVLKQFPTVKVFDSLPAFCDLNYCWASKDGKILYQDSNHLNNSGAIHLGEYFILNNK
ncbi:acyltransferase family protein [Crenothrix sp.]|uniref:acyltransferase family protein n=1 Tax=Crenothrix sp. TaxID=3100433 RepID=UPI00374CA626